MITEKDLDELKGWGNAIPLRTMFPITSKILRWTSAWRNGVAIWKSYGSRVVLVASVNRHDWRVYIDATSEKSHEKAVQAVLETGTKLLEEHARCLFPGLARWADQKRLLYGR